MEKEHPIRWIGVILFVGFLLIGLATHITWLTTILAVMCYLISIYIGWSEVKYNITHHIINEPPILAYTWYIILEIMMAGVFIGLSLNMIKFGSDMSSVITIISVLNVGVLTCYLKIGGQHKTAKKYIPRQFARKILPIWLIVNFLLPLIGGYIYRSCHHILGMTLILLWLALGVVTSFFIYRYDIKE
ncbi:hypothetical protein [Staphylococcus pettenkoferi]|uniref:hypothetical protein n=1 Tax=Staphylococcus pettenkoferi TaxID=170573 RepID=UPI002552FBA9|nr:hypothetical protein [Staphylococcus pettenkoferi]MDK7115140.1 hypothetical protein [Staphylococcus pettenkoferi]